MSESHHLVPLMAPQDARFHALGVWHFIIPRITCQNPGKWLAGSVLHESQGDLVLIRND